MPKILIFKLGALGDLSYLLPAIDQIHTIDAHSEITWIVGQTYAPLLSLHPKILRIVSIDEKKLFQGTFFDRIKEVLKLWKQIGFAYDQVWVCHRTLSAFLILRFRIFGRFFQIVRNSTFWKCVRHEIVIPPLTIHEGLAFKALTELALSFKIDHSHWKLDLNWIPEPKLPMLLPKKFIAIHLGGGTNAKTEFQLKRWPYWKDLIQNLLEKTTSPILLIGAASEKSEVTPLQPIISQFKERIIPLVGETTLPELVGILKACQLFIGVDSGPLHWADSLDKPCVGLYGPTSPISWGLIGKHSISLTTSQECSPCYRDDGIFPKCSNQMKCMTQLDVQKVFQKISNLC